MKHFKRAPKKNEKQITSTCLPHICQNYKDVFLFLNCFKANSRYYAISKNMNTFIHNQNAIMTSKKIIIGIAWHLNTQISSVI